MAQQLNLLPLRRRTFRALRCAATVIEDHHRAALAAFDSGAFWEACSHFSKASKLAIDAEQVARLYYGRISEFPTAAPAPVGRASVDNSRNLRENPQEPSSNTRLLSQNVTSAGGRVP